MKEAQDRDCAKGNTNDGAGGDISNKAFILYRQRSYLPVVLGESNSSHLGRLQRYVN